MDYFSIDGTVNECFVLFHGTGGNEYSLLQIAGDINPHASIISFIGSVGEGKERRFFKPLVNGKINREDFQENVLNFLSVWEGLAIRGKKVTFIGFSNGANFILGLLEKEPNIADRILLMHPANLEYSYKNGSEVDIFITTGALDSISIPGDIMKLIKQLEQQFPNTTLKLLDSAHNVTEQEIDYIRQRLK